MRIGHGYDVHRLREGRPFILCGVTVPFDRGPDGHSDGDAAVHALIDALLGALALGDIGLFFPDTDPRYKDADSLELLRSVCATVREKGYALSNADLTIVAQEPKLSPYIARMRETVAAALGVPADKIGVKATTEEKLGFTGQGLGVACHAVVLLEEIHNPAAGG